MTKNTKRALSWMLCITLLVVLLPASAFAAGTMVIRIDTSNYANPLEVGEQIRLPVVIDSNDGFAVANIGIDFDADVFTIVSIENGDIAGDRTSGADNYLFLDANGENNTSTGTLFYVTFEVKSGAPGGSTNIAAKYATGYADDISDENGDAVSVTFTPGTVTIAAAVVPLSFTDGANTYNYATLHADSYTLTAPGADYYFAGWFTGLTADGTKIVLEDGRYVLSSADTDDGDSFAITETRPKYDAAPADGAYNALWVHENDTNPTAMALEVYANSITYRKVSYTEADKQIITSNDVLRAAWSHMAGGNNGRVKLVKDLTTDDVSYKGSASSGYFSYGLWLDLNGCTITDTFEPGVSSWYSGGSVLYLRNSGSAVDSSHGQGRLVLDTSAKGGYTSRHCLDLSGNSQHTVKWVRDVDLVCNCPNAYPTALQLGGTTLELIDNVNITQNCQAGNTFYAMYSSDVSSRKSYIEKISNCTVTTNGTIFRMDTAGAYVHLFENCTFTSTATTGNGFEVSSDITFGAGNVITTNAPTLFAGTSNGGGKLAFTAPGTYSAGEGGEAFDGNVIFVETPTDGYVAHNNNGTLEFVEGFTLTYKNHDGTETLWTDSYTAGETPVDNRSLTYPVDHVSSYTFDGWGTGIGTGVIDVTALSADTTLYAQRTLTTLEPVVIRTIEGGETESFAVWEDAVDPGYDNWGKTVTYKFMQDATIGSSVRAGYYKTTYDLNGHTVTYTGTKDFYADSYTSANSSFTLTSTAAEKGTLIITGNAALIGNSTSNNQDGPFTLNNVRVEAENFAPSNANSTSFSSYSTPSGVTGLITFFNSGTGATAVYTLSMTDVELYSPNAPAIDYYVKNNNANAKMLITLANCQIEGGSKAVNIRGVNGANPVISLTADVDCAFKNAAGTDPITTAASSLKLTTNYPAGYALAAADGGWYTFQPALSYNDGAAKTETGLDPVITETTVGTITVNNAENLRNFDSLTVTNNNATVVFSDAALESIASNASGNVVLNIAPKASANGSAAETLVLTITDGTNPIAFNGEVTVTIPAPDASKNYEVFFNDGGTLTAMNAVRDGNNLVFTTTHFSDYDVIEEYSFTGVSLTGMTETTTGVTSGKVYKGTAVTAEYTYTGASSIDSITASVAGGESFAATESGGVWTVTVPADKVVGDITVTAAMSDPVFDIYYVITGTDTEPDNFYEIDPGASVDVDVYIKSDKTKNLQAFDIYPIWDSMLTYNSITPVSGIAITTDAMGAAHPHFQSVSTALNLEVGSAGVKIATINFTLSADAVYEEHYPVYFSDLSNLAIGLTPQSTVIGTMDTTGTMGAETVTKVNVSFNVNGGEGTMADQEVGYNKATALNENTFTREGYTFIGWNTAADGSGTAYADKAEITTKAAVELFAQWEIKTYTITWENDDGTVLATDTVNHGETPSYTGATPTKAEDTQYSYTFSGWTPAVSAATGDVTYTATYTQTARTYTITLVANGGEYANGYTAPTGYSYGDTVALPTDAEISKAGYIFGGWYEASDFSGSAVTEVSATDTGDKTFYAKWTAEDYTIIFKDGDTVLATEQYNTESTGDIKSLYDDPTKEGYTFSTWQVSVTGGNWPAAGTSVGSSTTLAGKTGNVTLNALWSTDTYTITYNLDGGTVALSNPTTYSVTTDTFTLNNPTKEGYTFLGWSGTGLTGTDNLTVTIAIGSTGNREYTANWQINQYTISFDSDDGSPVDPITGDYGDPVTPPDEPTKPGYEFGGWDPTLPGTIPGEDITVTAIWIPITYTVTFNGNGSTSGSMEPETFTYDVEQALTANAFAKTGNTFLGWAESAGGTVVYTDGQSVKNLRDTKNANVDLFAVWQANTYTVTFVDENNDVVGEVDFTYGDSSVTEPIVPEKPGYTGTWEGYTLADSDITVHPEYTVITYTITYVLDGGTNPDGAVNSYNIESTDTLPTPTKDLSVFGGWKISYATGESCNWTADAVVNAGTAVTGYYGNVTLTAQWTADFSYVVENYKYATDEYVMLRIADELGDSSKVYTFDGAAMYYTTDSTYLVNVGDSGVFFTLIPTATYTDTTTLTSAGVEKLSVEDGARADVVRDGDVNGTAPVNIADANAVYQMVQNGGSYYTIDQLVNVLRLGADMARENWNSTDHRGTLADVNVIVNMINDAANN